MGLFIHNLQFYNIKKRKTNTKLQRLTHGFTSIKIANLLKSEPL